MRQLTLLLIPAAILFTAAPVWAGDPPCKDILTDNQTEDEDITCFCTADDVENGGTVWGTDTYTDDSSVCRAGAHAGVIDASGGTITLRRSEGCSSYQGSLQNGVESDNWGSWKGSFFFPELGDPNCSATAGQSSTGISSCPANFASQASNGVPLTCVCDKSQLTGTIWGTQTYTSDSSICAAAVHAGVITSGGGVVTVSGLRGCQSYTGSTRNGITSQDYGKWSSSFFFPVAGAGNCP